ncbi:MAG: hypothetical protein WBG82_04830 [Parvibaculum sp.]|uniref:hypothetical protein n=1 Tax=Parvibaculum sp. TaxID=2024848 RepID=UPI003C721522
MNQSGFDRNHIDPREPPMKVAMVGASDEGGASRAAIRLNSALAGAGAQSRLLVETKTTDDPLILGPRGLRRSIRKPHRRKWAAQIKRLQTGDGAADTRSINLFESPMLMRLKKFDADVVNLHWIGDESISIAQIGQIEKLWSGHCTTCGLFAAPNTTRKTVRTRAGATVIQERTGRPAYVASTSKDGPSRARQGTGSSQSISSPQAHGLQTACGRAR